MARQSKKSDGPTGLEELREEFGRFLSGLAQGWIDKAGDKVSDVTDRLSGIGEGEGGALGIGSRVLRGESPLKAVVGQKAKDAKDKVVDTVKGAVGAGGGDEGGQGEVKAVNIVESLDVGVPLRTVYDHWTQFEDFSGFTKGVRGVSQEDDTTTTWDVKVGPSGRSWKATVQEQVPDERIVWTSEGAKGSTAGAVSFHGIGPCLTRILVVVEYTPAGFFEKTGNLWRAQGRRLRLDLKHFGRHVTLHADEEVEGWRGEIRDGEVVRSHEEGLEDDEPAEDEEAEEEEEQSEEPDEEEAEDEEDGSEEDEDDEDVKAPPRKRTRSRR
ncbi:hypothetical protein RVR_268 [Actinacidiphila reveromycinica]|uniref:Coenzyme Q-binding protein COQ10 START domain-containing protein n=1 Tax=Actinacidiphila reveromycinica TaxID=659352 RepID=A0A7U3UMR3_9ACTN|nr:SRPBCC family protein [Streptomyces sp. SN-593]BBA95422.1 hypothetical protein RVR_268 [Streptomyces sp. SN-593]